MTSSRPPPLRSPPRRGPTPSGNKRGRQRNARIHRDRVDLARDQHHELRRGADAAGNLPGFVSVIDRYAAGELTVILLCNIDSGRIGRTGSSIEAMAFHQPYDLPRGHKIIAVPPGSNAPLAGAYKTDDGRTVTISEGKRFLEAAMPNEYVAGLLLEAPRQFYMPLGEGTFTFSAEPDRARTLIISRPEGAAVQS